MTVLVGLCRCTADGAPEFVNVGVLTDEELHALQQSIFTRLMKLLAGRDVLAEDMDQSYGAEPDAAGEEAHILRPLQPVVITYRIAFGSAPCGRFWSRET